MWATCLLEIFIYYSHLLTTTPFRAWLLMTSCEWFKWLSNTTCYRSAAIYLITDAVGNEWNLIETAIIIIVRLPVNLPISMMSFSSWLQIDCVSRHLNTCTQTHPHKHTDEYFRNMSGLYQRINMFFYYSLGLCLWMAPGNQFWNQQQRDVILKVCD